MPGAQIERDEQLRTFQAYTNRFRSPYEQSYSTNPLYYSLDVGPIHVIMLNAVRTTSLPVCAQGVVCTESMCHCANLSGCQCSPKPLGC